MDCRHSTPHPEWNSHCIPVREREGEGGREGGREGGWRECGGSEGGRKGEGGRGGRERGRSRIFIKHPLLTHLLKT